MTRPLGLVLGFVGDQLLGDPARLHPVAGFGALAGRLEHSLYADSRSRGAAYAGVLVVGTTTLGVVAERALRDRPLLHVLGTAAGSWVVLGARSLDREAAAVERLLAAERLDDARRRLTHLVGRDTTQLDEAGIARAVIESVAENTSDAVVAPLLLGAVAGLPGLLGYRAANTLDAMVGHRSSRHERFGWASARLDDLLNLPGSRLSALLAAGLGDDPRAALVTWRRDAGGHPSPNAGPVEASFAGALGVRLGGVNVYDERVEDRHALGDGRAPGRRDIARARRLALRVDLAAVTLTAVGSWLLSRRATSRRPRRR